MDESANKLISGKHWTAAAAAAVAVAAAAAAAVVAAVVAAAAAICFTKLTLSTAKRRVVD